MKIIDTVKGIILQELPIMLAMPALLWIFLLLIFPFLCMVYTSLLDDSVVQAYTLSHYSNFFELLYLHVISRSLFLATGTAIITLLIGYPVAYFIAFRANKNKNMLLFLLTLPFWTNLIIQVYAWFFILERTGLINTLLLQLGIISHSIQFAYNMYAILLLLIYCYLPFMTLPIYTILQKFDTKLIEASMDLGATRWQTFWRITFPLSLPGIKTGFLLVFVPSFGDFVIPSLIGGSRYLTVGSLISYYFLTAQNTASGAAFTVLSGCVLMGSIFIMQKCLTSIVKEQ